MNYLDEPTTSYLILEGDDYPETLIYFAPTGTEVTKFSSPRFGLWDEDEGYQTEHASTSEDIVEKFYAALTEADMTEDDNDESGRFRICDARDADLVLDWFEDGEFGSHYVHTDAWRGYTVVDYNGRWEEYTGGWVTGYPDESTSHKMTAADLHNALYEGDLVPPFPIVWYFGRTSNVFSQTSDILIPSGQREEFETWLAEVGYLPEAVERAFG
jgi:hypothetical protein